jgi:HAD superfamily hydrolase (TIGR01509 family)
MFPNPVRGALFDMDGLLIDSEAVYIKGMQAAAQTLGREMSLAFCHSMVGVPGSECNVLIQELYGPGFSIEEFRAIYSVKVREIFEAGIPVKAGVVELLDFLDAHGLPRAVATSATRTTVEHHLGRAGLLDRFSAVVTRDDVVHAKPAPDIYLEAARRLGLPPATCLGFEDSNIGLTAAHAAGTMAIMVPDILQPSDEVRAKCLHIAPDLHAVRRVLQQALGEGAVTPR